jgi:hypothetical protein
VKFVHIILVRPQRHRPGLGRISSARCFGQARLVPGDKALDRFGSAAAGDPVYETGDALGKLLRTIYLCDYLSNQVFRTEVLDLLNQGEAVHSLQRAIHNGMITAKHGAGKAVLITNLSSNGGKPWTLWGNRWVSVVCRNFLRIHRSSACSAMAPIYYPGCGCSGPTGTLPIVPSP